MLIMIKALGSVSVPGKTCPPLVVPIKGNTKLAGSVILLGTVYVVPLAKVTIFSQYKSKSSKLRYPALPKSSVAAIESKIPTEDELIIVALEWPVQKIVWKPLSLYDRYCRK